MIIIQKGNTGNTICTTFNESLNKYSLTGLSSYTFFIENDLNKTKNYTIDLPDLSTNKWRYNKFILNETDYNFTNGLYSYSAFTSSAKIQILESGKLLVFGVNTTNKSYW